MPVPWASLVQTGSIPSDREGSEKGVSGLQLWEMGGILGRSLRGGSSLCSQPTEGERNLALRTKQSNTFPLPTLREQVLPIPPKGFAWTVDWLISICMALNSFCGRQKLSCQECHRADGLPEDAESSRLKDVKEVTGSVDWGTRTIDYKGDEVRQSKTADSSTLNWSSTRESFEQIPRFPQG